MRCNPLRWLWGLIPVAMLTLLANHWERPVIEADLGQRAKQMLDRQGLDWADVAFEGRDATLTGRASEDGDPKKAIAALRNTWGVRTVNPKTDLVAEVDTFAWAAALDGKKIALTGFVPSEQARRTVVQTVKTSFPKASVDDQTKVARGAPKTDLWLSGVGFAVKQLAALKKGSVGLEGTALSIEGEAADQGSYKALRAALPGQLPKGWQLGRDKVSAPAADPFTWSAKLAANQLVLSGFAPGEAEREQIFGAAKTLFPRVAVVDRLEVASGAPEGWAEAAGVALDQLYQLREGDAEMRDKELALSGVAEDEPSANAVRAGLKSKAPRGYKTSAQITFPKPRMAAVEVFATSVDAGAGSVDVSGYAPSDEAKTALLDAVRSAFPGKAVMDKLEIATGAPADWQTCMLAGTQALSRLGAGRASLEGAALGVTGDAADEALAQSVTRELAGAAGTACKTTASIKVPDLRQPKLWWRAELAAGTVILEGEAPDADARSTLAAAAKAVFPNARIEDRMTVVAKRSQSWGKATGAAVLALSRLDKGVATLFHDDVHIEGEARSDGAVAAVRKDLAGGLPQGYAGRDTIKTRTAATIDAEAAALGAAEEVRRRAEEEAAAKRRAAEVGAAEQRARQSEADKCQRLLKDTAAGGTIRFEYASDLLDKASRPTLDKLAVLANTCPGTRVIIEGHTDSDGDPNNHQGLSERRAQSVVNYLTAAGVTRGRLSAVGYGATRPLVPNTTAANKQKNRRIAFSVVAN